MTMQNLVVVTYTVCPHIGGPRNFGDASWILCGGGVVNWPRRNTLLVHVYYHTKFCRLLCQTIWASLVSRGPKEFCGHWAPLLKMGACLTSINIINMFLPLVLPSSFEVG